MNNKRKMKKKKKPHPCFIYIFPGSANKIKAVMDDIFSFGSPFKIGWK
jgi:hypothetical protein